MHRPSLCLSETGLFQVQAPGNLCVQPENPALLHPDSKWWTTWSHTLLPLPEAMAIHDSTNRLVGCESPFCLRCYSGAG